MMPRADRVALLDRETLELPLRTQADLLSLNRSSLYYVPTPPSLDDVALKHRIDELYTEYPFYGVRRITAQVRREGLRINHKAVERHMREMGLRGLSPGPTLSPRSPRSSRVPLPPARGESEASEPDLGH